MDRLHPTTSWIPIDRYPLSAETMAGMPRRKSNSRRWKKPKKIIEKIRVPFYRAQNGVVKNPKDYQDIFLRPNLGESMRYGKTYYVSKEDCKKIKALMRCFGDGWERFPLSVYIHNLLEYHFNEFAELIDEMMRRQQVPNPFQQK